MKVALVDIDRTLFYDSWREYLLPKKAADAGPGNWDIGSSEFKTHDFDEYHRVSVYDQEVEEMRDLVNCLGNNFKVVLLTTRPEKWRDITAKKLVDHRINASELLMRPDDDHGLSTESKLRIALEHYPKEEIAFIIDDRDDICDVFFRAGIITLRVKIIDHDGPKEEALK